LAPHRADVSRRIRYEDGQFVAVADDDIEALNLIRYLGWNRPELAEDRTKHVGRMRQLRSFLEDISEDFLGYLREHPEELSFATALEAELGIDLSGLAQPT
jgi:hypothetical protein